MTRAQVIANIKSRLVNKRVSELVWGDITASVVALNAGQKQAIVTAFRSQDPQRVSRLLFRAVHNKVVADAQTEADAMMADDSLSLTELQRILG